MDKFQQRLMNDLGRARDSLLTSIEGLDERTATSAPVLGDWTVKDIIGHVVAWGDELRSEIDAILIDPTPRYSYVISSDRDYDEWNRGQVAARRSSSLPEILAEFETDCEETAQLLSKLAPDDLQRRGVVPWKIRQLPPPEEVTSETSISVAALLEIHIQHLSEHAEEIRRWRSEPSSSIS